MIRVIFQGNRFGFAFRPVGQDHLQGIEHSHGAQGGVAQHVADTVLQYGVIHGGIGLAHADGIHEIANGHGRIAATTHGRQGGHPGIIPAGHIAAFHQLAEVTLGHDRTGHVQAGKLNLTGTGGQHVRALFHDPVIKGTVNFIFKGAHGMADAFQRVADGVGKVIHGIDAPLAAGAPVLLIQDAVHGRIPHDDVR